MRRSDAEILGRACVDDVDAIVAACETAAGDGAGLHAVADPAPATFTWDYDKGARPRLDRLYEKAKVSQWNASTDLDWSIEVDPTTILGQMEEELPPTRDDIAGDRSSPLHNWGDAEWERFGVESVVWRMSQFLHGEQGALLCTAKIVETVPWIDAKFYAATQVVDEARHVEVFGRYLETKLGDRYPISPHLGSLLDEILSDSRWDMTYLGMQIMVEGLALAAFGFMREVTAEPLLRELLRLVMRDEARHVAFGVLSLSEVYEQLSAAEIRERQEFAFEAAVRMRDRFLQQEVYERMGVPVRPMVERMLALPPERQAFQRMLFSKIVPNCSKLGLLDAGDGWLRTKFGEIGVLEFEDWPDTEAELDAFSVGPRPPMSPR
ncbi:MAG: ferritin-like domain-containing protein [Acidimicrobiales bacterium]